jgi:biotin carboxylase
MTPENTLLLIAAPASVIQKAKALGLDVILFTHKTKYAPQRADLADITIIGDITDWAVARKVARAAYDTWGFAAALSLTDPGVAAAARINDEYGLGGTGYEVARRFIDKLAMRRLLAGTDLAVGAEPLTDRAGLADFARRYGYPVIVKPADAAASLGVHRIDGPEDVDGVLAKVEELRANGTTRGCGALFTIDDYVVEEYVTGPEFSVEAFSFHGRHVPIAITEKLMAGGHFAELGHTVPARVTAADEAAIEDTVVRFLDLMGLTDGPSHTEFKLTPRGPVIIESHNRIGGDRLDEVVAAVHGVDMKSYAVGWPFGLVDELPGRPPASGAASHRVLRAAPGRVVAIDGADEVAAHPDTLFVDVHVQVGDVVPEVGDNLDSIGWVAVTGPDSDAAIKLCDEMVGETMRIEVAGE